MSLRNVIDFCCLQRLAFNIINNPACLEKNTVAALRVAIHHTRILSLSLLQRY